MTSEGKPGQGIGHPFDDDFPWEDLAAWGDAAGHDLTGSGQLSEQTLIQRLLREQDRVDPSSVIDKTIDQTNFEERHADLIVGHDPIGLVRRLPRGRLEGYLEKLLSERVKRGKNESVVYGIGRILGQRAVIYAMLFEYMGGSMGVVAGEKFQHAADLATGENLPLVGLFASGGVRQQENFAGLVQMERMVEAVRKFKTRTHRPYIAVLAGSWGGISASAVPNADLTVGLAGTDYGFTGPRVIRTYEGIAVPQGSQTVENNLLDRNIDVLVKDVEELIGYLGHFIRVSKKARRSQLTVENLPRLQVPDKSASRVIALGRTGIASALYNRQMAYEKFEVGHEQPLSPELSEEEQLMKRYESFISSAGRPDSEFIIRSIFSDVIPLYNHYVDGDKKIYPAIIAAVARIGPQPFLIIANQPSYMVGDQIRRIPATPSPEDFDYATRMLKMGERLELPVIFLTDTLGAKPTIDSEKRGQSRSIAEMIYAANAYKRPVISVILSSLGSGGGLATAPHGDHRAMLENAMAFVAEPRSATSILYRKSHPDKAETSLTLQTMSATAQDQLGLGLIDEVIPESVNPRETAKNVYAAITKAFLDLESKRRLRARRSERIRGLTGGVTIEHLDES